MPEMVTTECIRCGVPVVQPKWRSTSKARKQTCGSKQCVYMRKGTTEDRLLAKTNKTATCWLWTGTKTSEGYGKLWDTKINEMGRAHRMSYELYVGPIPEGLQVCHHCDNPSCVNPLHLYTGTNDDNIADKMAKGRGKGNTGRIDDNVKAAIIALLNINISIKRISETLKVSERTIRKYAEETTSEATERE